MRARRPRRLACRYCGDEIDATNADAASHYRHSHPAACPHRTDSVPALNGVRVGDVWRSLHDTTGHATARIAEIRLGGVGTYTDREPVVILEHDDGTDFSMPWPLWCLVEHMEPITRPDEYPLPWEPDKRYRDSRSAADEWRGPAYRRDDGDERTGAYFHAWHTLSGHCSQGWGDPWLTDPDRDASLFDSQAVTARPTVTPQPPARARETAVGEQLALLL
jgi:hypothetical protein